MVVGRKETTRRYRESHKEQIKAQSIIYRKSEQGKATIKKNQELYKDRKKEYDRIYQKTGKAIETHKKWRDKNPEKVLGYMRNHLEKYGKPFKFDYYDYKMALHSWSKAIKQRDDNKCQVCGNTENLHVHHIFEKRFYPKLSLNTNNGITLCMTHHKDVHGVIKCQ